MEDAPADVRLKTSQDQDWDPSPKKQRPNSNSCPHPGSLPQKLLRQLTPSTRSAPRTSPSLRAVGKTQDKSPFGKGPWPQSHVASFEKRLCPSPTKLPVLPATAPSAPAPERQLPPQLELPGGGPAGIQGTRGHCTCEHGVAFLQWGHALLSALSCSPCQPQPTWAQLLRGYRKGTSGAPGWLSAWNARLWILGF